MSVNPSRERVCFEVMATPRKKRKTWNQIPIPNIRIVRKNDGFCYRVFTGPKHGGGGVHIRERRPFVWSGPLGKAASLCQRSCHLNRDHPLVVLLGGEQAKGDGGFLQAGAVGMGLLGDLGGIFIADVGVEGRHQHQ